MKGRRDGMLMGEKGLCEVGGKEDLMSLTFLSKKLAKSSGKSDESGGCCGGRSSDLNVPNSFLGFDAEARILER